MLFANGNNITWPWNILKLVSCKKETSTVNFI